MKTIEELIHNRKFGSENIFDPNDFNDWAKENEGEAYQICLEIARELLEDIKNIS